MISLLCQKTNQGIISPQDKTLYNYLLYSDDSNSVFKTTSNKLFENSFYNNNNNDETTNTLVSNAHSPTNRNHFINSNHNDNKRNSKLNNVNNNNSNSDQRENSNRINHSQSPDDVVLFKRVSFELYILFNLR
jgi:hypothetical protein